MRRKLISGRMARRAAALIRDPAVMLAVSRPALAGGGSAGGS